MSFADWNNAADRHPWLFSLGAGAILGLLLGVVNSSVVAGVLCGLAHMIIQLLVLASRRRARTRKAAAGSQ